MKGKSPKDDAARELRLAEALRANLKRRKERARRHLSTEQPDPRTKEQGRPE
jgi:hypothetical protein